MIIIFSNDVERVPSIMGGEGIMIYNILELMPFLFPSKVNPHHLFMLCEGEKIQHNRIEIDSGRVSTVLIAHMGIFY